MLVSQLGAIGLTAGYAVFSKVTAAWEQAAFSGSPDHSLRRYFSHQLEGISEFSDSRPVDQLILQLIDHLHRFYPAYLDPECRAPRIYRQRQNRLLAQKTAVLVSLFKERSENLFRSVSAYIAGMQNDGSAVLYTFRALAYYEKLVSELYEIRSCGADRMEAKLLELNFNHLEYLAARQKIILERVNQNTGPLSKLSVLQQERADVLAIPEQLKFVYHPDWPSLKTMLVAWLEEQIAALPQIQAMAKLRLNLSVAQLACFLRLIYDEGFFKEANLTHVFRFFTTHFSAKKQETISPGSLSKEYYSSGQVTAAVMRDKLLKMVARIDRNFFPVWIAIGIVMSFQ